MRQPAPVVRDHVVKLRAKALCQPPNKQLERTVIRQRVRTASAPFHYALAARGTGIGAPPLNCDVRHHRGALVKRTVISCLAVATLCHASVLRAAELEFEGTPSVKVVLLEGKPQSASVAGLEATELRVVIVREGDKYFWRSRENVPLMKTVSGSYVTYLAMNGAGYIRVLTPEMRKLREQLPAAEREKEYVYMEHLINQLRSVTYLGK